MADYSNPRPSSQPVGSTDQVVLKDNLITIDHVVNGVDPITNRKGDPVPSLTGIQDQIDDALLSLGWVIVGDFSDTVKAEVSEYNQVYTSKSIPGSECLIWRTNQALPYTPTGSDPTSGSELGKWLVVAPKVEGLTTSELLLNVATFDPSAVIETTGFYDSGDGGEGLWTPTGNTITPNQTPADTQSATLSDANGSEYELIQPSGQVKALSLGAVEDGVTDDSLTYQAAFNGAVSAVMATKEPRIAGLTCRQNMGFYGAKVGETKIKHYASDGIDMLTVQPTSDPSMRNDRFEAKGFTVEVEGEARSAIRLPKGLGVYQSQFTFDIDININLFELGPDGYSEAIRVGDCVQGNIRGEFRAGYVPANDDTGQYDSCAVYMDADRGNIGVTISMMTSNVRRPFRLGAFTEGFNLVNSELVNCWIGVDHDAGVDAKPGGFIGPDVHINSNFRGVKLVNRRDLNIVSCQFYRGSTYFDHGAKWAGIEVNGGTRFSVTNCNWRNVKATADDSLIDFATCSNFSITNSSCGNDVGIDVGFSLDQCSNFIIDDSTFAAGYGKWFILNDCSNYEIGSHTSDDSSLSSEVYSVTSDNSSGKINRSGASKNKYTERFFSASATENESINEITTRKKLSFTSGTGAYVVDVIMPVEGMVKGDVMEYFVGIATSGTNPTVNFKDGASTRYTITGDGTPKDYVVKMVFNGAGWVKGGLVAAS